MARFYVDESPNGERYFIDGVLVGRETFEARLRHEHPEIRECEEAVSRAQADLRLASLKLAEVWRRACL